MEKLRKVKKGEEGLNQLRDHFASVSGDYRAYELKNILSECIARSDDGYAAYDEIYGYNEDHDFAEGVISSYKHGDTYIHKETTTVTKAEGGTSNKMEYTVIKPDKKGRYNIMTIETYKKEPAKIIICDKIGTNAETKTVIDLAHDFPNKYNDLFNRAFDAMVTVDTREREYNREKKNFKENNAKKQNADVEMNKETNTDDESEL